MSDAVVRKGDVLDAPACAAIFNAWVDATDWMPRVHPADDVERYYRDVLFSDCEVYVAGDPVRCFMALGRDNFVTALYSSAPGNGHGKALIDRAKALRDRLQLWTFAANKSAQRFYAREGFSEAARTDGDNEEGLPDIRYEWRAS